MRTIARLLSIVAGALSTAAFVDAFLLVQTRVNSVGVGFYHDGGIGALLAMVIGFCLAAGAGRLWRFRR